MGIFTVYITVAVDSSELPSCDDLETALTVVPKGRLLLWP